MEHRLRENTMRTKKFIIDLKIILYFKKKNMNEIKASDIRAWQNALMKKGHSETYLKTVNKDILFAYYPSTDPEAYFIMALEHLTMGIGEYGYKK